MMNTQENLLMTEGEFFILAYLMAFYFKFPSDEHQLGHNLAFHNLRFLGMAVLKAWILSIDTVLCTTSSWLMYQTREPKIKSQYCYYCCAKNALWVSNSRYECNK